MTDQIKRPYFGGGRKPTGVLVRNKTGFSARFWTTIDGERVRVTRSLGTDSKAVAKRKLAALLAAENPAAIDASAPETFQQAAERVNADRKTAGLKTTDDELSRLKRFAFPEFGAAPVTKITTRHVNAALDAVRAAGRSRQTAVHVKQDVANVFAALKREDALRENPADGAELPVYAKTLRKVRAVLSDEELVRYLAWQHPDERHRMAVLERQTMSAVARCFGGLRTGDLHALRWEALHPPGPDGVGGFEWGFAPRRKTAAPQKLGIPEILRPVLHDWWERHGRPNEGPVFPVRRGQRVGAEKSKGSHAHAFRRDLRRAFGLETWNPSAGERGRFESTPGRATTARERELLEPTAHTLPADFHSWRRAYAQALADAGVNAQMAKALAAHATEEAHERYLVNPGKVASAPAAALPAVMRSPRAPSNDAPEQESAAESFASVDNSENRGFYQSGWQDLNLQQPAPKKSLLRTIAALRAAETAGNEDE